MLVMEASAVNGMGGAKASSAVVDRSRIAVLGTEVSRSGCPSHGDGAAKEVGILLPKRRRRLY